MAILDAWSCRRWIRNPLALNINFRGHRGLGLGTGFSHSSPFLSSNNHMSTRPLSFFNEKVNNKRDSKNMQQSRVMIGHGPKRMNASPTAAKARHRGCNRFSLVGDTLRRAQGFQQAKHGVMAKCSPTWQSPLNDNVGCSEGPRGYCDSSRSFCSTSD